MFNLSTIHIEIIEGFSLLSLQVVQKVVYMEVFTMTTHLQRSTGVEQTMKCKMFGFNIPFYLPISDLYQISEPIYFVQFFEAAKVLHSFHLLSCLVWFQLDLSRILQKFPSAPRSVLQHRLTGPCLDFI